MDNFVFVQVQFEPRRGREQKQRGHLNANSDGGTIAEGMFQALYSCEHAIICHMVDVDLPFSLRYESSVDKRRAAPASIRGVETKPNQPPPFQNKPTNP